MMSFANYFITIFINHDVNSSIVNQIKLLIFFVNKFNFKLIKTSMYLSQFRIKIFHRSEKLNIIFNVFFLFIHRSQQIKKLYYRQFKHRRIQHERRQ